MLSIIFGLKHPTYSLSCEKQGVFNWNEFNHPKLTKGSFEKLSIGEESYIIKIKGYVYFLHKNKVSGESCEPLLVIEPIFFDENYRYIILSNSDKKLKRKIKECLAKPLRFGTPEQNHTDYPLVKRNDLISALVKQKVIHPHPEIIKTCEVVLEGEIRKEKLPYLDAWYAGNKSRNELTRPIFVTESINLMKKLN